MSIYEVISKTIDLMDKIESNAAAIETLYASLKDMLRARGIYFMAHDIQAIRVDKSDKDIIIEIFLQSTEIWVKIYKDGGVDASIYPLLKCECG
jgi:hypothetical protein